jgi:hypothetical protein
MPAAISGTPTEFAVPRGHGPAWILRRCRPPAPGDFYHFEEILVARKDRGRTFLVARAPLSSLPAAFAAFAACHVGKRLVVFTGPATSAAVYDAV